MRILVTGGSGFLGGHIADALSDAGHRVVVFDVRRSDNLRPDQEMAVGNVLDPDEVAAAAAGCQAVYHLAAVADIGEALASPRRTIEVNVMGALNALEAARTCGARRFVFASSIYVYSDQGSFYRTSKQAGEQLAFDFQERYGLDYTVLRFGSLFGPRAGPNNAIHRMLHQALTERRIDYPGTGDEIREYIHVFDAAAMSVDILAPEFANQIVHLAGRERMTTGDMLRTIAEILGGGVDLRCGAGGVVGHYMLTPYNFTPRLGRRMTRNSYIDLGLGLLDCVQRLHGELTGEPTGDGADAAAAPANPGETKR